MVSFAPPLQLLAWSHQRTIHPGHHQCIEDFQSRVGGLADAAEPASLPYGTKSFQDRHVLSLLRLPTRGLGSLRAWSTEKDASLEDFCGSLRKQYSTQGLHVACARLGVPGCRTAIWELNCKLLSAGFKHRLSRRNGTLIGVRRGVRFHPITSCGC